MKDITYKYLLLLLWGMGWLFGNNRYLALPTSPCDVQRSRSLYKPADTRLTKLFHKLSFMSLVMILTNLTGCTKILHVQNIITVSSKKCFRVLTCHLEDEILLRMYVGYQGYGAVLQQYSTCPGNCRAAYCCVKCLELHLTTECIRNSPPTYGLCEQLGDEPSTAFPSIHNVL